MMEIILCLTPDGSSVPCEVVVPLTPFICEETETSEIVIFCPLQDLSGLGKISTKSSAYKSHALAPYHLTSQKESSPLLCFICVFISFMHGAGPTC